MKNLLLSALALCSVLAGAAPTEKTAPEGYRFTDTKTIRTTPVKNQNRTGINSLL